MNPTGKKFISLFLVFSLMMLSVNLHAKERRGATIVITKKDRTQFQGELIAVKQNSLLILVPEGKDVSFDITDIMLIRIVEKSNKIIGALIGGLIGGGIGVAVGLTDDYYPGLAAYFYGMIGGGIGAILGMLPGLLTGKDKKIQPVGMTDSEIQDTLDYLRMKARIRDYK